jgi:hypothetical protein
MAYDIAEVQALDLGTGLGDEGSFAPDLGSPPSWAPTPPSSAERSRPA